MRMRPTPASETSVPAVSDERSGSDRETRPRRRAERRWAVRVLVGVGGLLAFLAVFSIWVNRQLLNTENWVDTSTALLQNEEVRGRLSEYLSEQLLLNAEPEAEIAKALPPRLAPLAGPATAAIEGAVPRITERVLAAPRFQGLWETANRAAHEALLQVLDGGGKAVSTDNGEVILRLGPALETVGERVGIGGGLVSKIPADAGELTILRSDQLSFAQEVTKAVRKLPVVLTLLALLCFGLAVWLAGPRRRQALGSVGYALLAAGLLILLLRHFAGPYVVGALAQTKVGEPAIAAAWGIGTSLLATVAVSALFTGLLVAVGAWLAGPSRHATEARRRLAPQAANASVYWGIVALVFVVLLLWAPIAALEKPLGVLILAVLLGTGAEMLRRQIVAEFPTAVASEPKE